jgi:putative chitinase
MKRIAPEWYRILVTCSVKPTTAAIWSEIFAACVEPNTFSAGDEDLRNFLGQVLHESAMLERLEENLNYSALGLARTWPNRYARRYRGKLVKPYEPNALALSLHRKPEAIANNCYANRMGNGDEASGDGWAHRGSGLIMVTGKDNFALVERVSGIRCVENPELLRQPLPALQASIAWWEHSVPDSLLGDPERVSEAVNGGHIGLDDRLALTEAASAALQA